MSGGRHSVAAPFPATEAFLGFLAALGAAWAVSEVQPLLSPIPLAAYGAALAFGRRLSATVLLGVFVAAFLLVPQQYNLAAQLPADVRADRLVLAALLAGWALGLLRPRQAPLSPVARRTGLPLLGFLAVALISLLLNAPRTVPEGFFVEDLKSFLLLGVLVATYFLTLKVTGGARGAARIAAVAVAAGTVAAAIGVFERLAGFNPLAKALLSLPGVTRARPDVILSRGSELRVMGTGEHPIAFGGLMAMLLPLALYFALTSSGRRRMAYTLASVTIGAAMLFSVSRSALLSTVVAGVVLFALWPSKRRFLGGVAIALVVGVGVLAPDLLATLGRAMRPAWVVAQEQASYSSRLGDYPAVARIIPKQPLFGLGWMGFAPGRFFYLDNQLLKVLLEVGAAGAALAAWFFARVARSLWIGARSSAEEYPIEAAALASLAAFAVLSLLFDTFGFSQIAYAFFVISALGVAAASEASAAEDRRVPGF